MKGSPNPGNDLAITLYTIGKSRLSGAARE